MTLASARSYERRRRVLAFAGTLALTLAGTATGAVALAGAGYVHRIAVLQAYGFDMHARADWKRLDAQWRAGRFALDTARRVGFAASILGGGAASAALAIVVGLRLPRAMGAGAKAAWSALRRPKRSVPALPAAAPAAAPGVAAVPPPAKATTQAPEAAPTVTVAEAAANLAPEVGSKFGKTVAKYDALLNGMRDEVQERAEQKAQRDIKAYADGEAEAAESPTRPSAAPPAASAADLDAEAEQTLARIRRDAAACEAEILEGEAFECAMVVVVGRKIFLVTVFVEPGDWDVHDTAERTTWTTDSQTIESPAFAATRRAARVIDALGGRFSAPMDVRPLLAIGGAASILSIDAGCQWDAYNVVVGDASADESAGTGINSVANILRDHAMPDRVPEGVVEALRVYAEITAEVARREAEAKAAAA